MMLKSRVNPYTLYQKKDTYLQPKPKARLVVKQTTTFKTLLLAIAVIFTTTVTNAQTNLGVGTASPDASAKLDVTSTNQGILVPRMTTAARTSIATPAKGLMVYDSTIKAFYYHDGTAWVAVGGAGAGASLQLLATKTTGSQILANANGTNTGDLVTFNNVVTTPTSGSYTTSTNAYTASVAGLYYIQAASRCDDNASALNTLSQFLYVDINGGGLSSVANVLPIYAVGGAGNFPAQSKGRGYVGTMVYLNANDVVTIKGLSANSSVVGTTLKTDGSCKFMVVKL
jgi:hypothetical protein